jgi:hypothetical protein
MTVKWTAEEDAEMVRLAGLNWLAHGIGLKLGRTEVSVISRARKLKVCVRMTEQEVKQVRRHLKIFGKGLTPRFQTVPDYVLAARKRESDRLAALEIQDDGDLAPRNARVRVPFMKFLHGVENPSYVMVEK